MDGELQNKLYYLEVTPPDKVWEKLSASLDEINADLALARRIKNNRMTPPADAWENISYKLEREKEEDSGRNGFVYYFKRLAAAAVFAGLIITAWVIYNNYSSANSEIASDKSQHKESTPADTNTNSININTDNQVQVIPGREISVLNPGEKLFGQVSPSKNFAKKKNFKHPEVQQDYWNENQIALHKEKPGEKKFTTPVEDLSMVGDGEHYMTMLNANGRLVKISPQLAHLAPHLQDKPVTEDLYEIMFGEGEYWRETLSEWRKKLALSPAGSGDVFSSLIELLKTVGNN
jgi:hypothetical protein